MLDASEQRCEALFVKDVDFIRRENRAVLLAQQLHHDSLVAVIEELGNEGVKNLRPLANLDRVAEHLEDCSRVVLKSKIERTFFPFVESIEGSTLLDQILDNFDQGCTLPTLCCFDGLSRSISHVESVNTRCVSSEAM